MDKSQNFTFGKEDSPGFQKKIPASKIIQTKQKRKKKRIFETGIKKTKTTKLRKFTAICII